MITKLNGEWHKTNRMPKNPTFEQRLEWHSAHVKHCACRKPTGEILAELQNRNLVDAEGNVKSAN